MAFRADEAGRTGREEAEDYLVGRGVDPSERTRSAAALRAIIDELGPVVDTYPTWHPLVRNHDRRRPTTTPHADCGYRGLDHTRFFANGFVTCPYASSGKAEKVLASVEALPRHPAAFISAARLDVQLYNPDAAPVLVKCEWNLALGIDGTIPAAIAVPLILEQELPHWPSAELAETWESMRHYFLGSPSGSRSSLFVNQETGQAIKKIWNALIQTGMFGSIKG